MKNPNMKWHELDDALQMVTKFVDTWSPYLHGLENLDDWRSWKGDKLPVDTVYEIVDTALWCMTEGEWSLAAELLDIVASSQIIERPDSDVVVERFCWGD